MTKTILRRYLQACADPSSSRNVPITHSEGQNNARISAADSLCDEDSLQGWFDPLDISLNATRSVLHVHFPHFFFGLRFEKLFKKLFENAAHQIWGNNLVIQYTAGNRTSDRFIRKRASESTHHKHSETVEQSLTAEKSISENGYGRDVSSHREHVQHGTTFSQTTNPFPYGSERTFDTFLSNGKHKWALGLVREVTRKAVTHEMGRDTSQRDNPGILVLCGPHGTGKTHILKAMGNELHPVFSNALLYVSLSELELLFSSEHPLYVRQSLMAKQAILLDDFQYMATMPDVTEKKTLSGKDKVCFQEELCLVIDHFMDQGKLFVVAGAGHPRDWNLHRALLSRLETGLWTELPEPDLDIRLRYVQQQARQKRLPLLREQMMLLAQHCSDIRKLSGVIRRVISHRNLVGHDLTEQDILNIIRQSGDSSPLTAQQIVSIVGEHCGVSPRDILGEKRRPDLVQARQLSMYLCRELLGHSYPVIGRMFGGKDHSTVMHSVKKIKLLQDNDRIMHTKVTELTKACLERRD